MYVIYVNDYLCSCCNLGVILEERLLRYIEYDVVLKKIWNKSEEKYKELKLSVCFGMLPLHV